MGEEKGDPAFPGLRGGPAWNREDMRDTQELSCHQMLDRFYVGKVCILPCLDTVD